MYPTPYIVFAENLHVRRSDGDSDGSIALSSPIDVVRNRLEILSGRPPRWRARCPVHGSRGGTLSVRELPDGSVLLHCFFGCRTLEIVKTLGLSMNALFSESSVNWRGQRDTMRRRMRSTPVPTTKAMLRRELARIREEQRARIGYDPPVTSRTINEVRARVGRIAGVELAPVEAFAWECAPHDDDPLWPMLFDRALEQLAWDSDPDCKTPCGTFRAQVLAAGWLHEIAESAK